MQIDDGFRRYVAHLNLEAVAQSPDVVYFVDRNFVLRGFNGAWTRFALANQGARTLRSYPVGCSILSAMSPEARTFYLRKYEQVLERREGFQHSYECSSPAVFRRFLLSAHPLPERRGLLISNHLIEEHAHVREAMPLTSDYLSPLDIVVQCCHCRRTHNQAHKERWDWVPLLVQEPHPHTASALCPECFDYFYQAS